MYFNDPFEAEYLAAGGRAGFRLINPITEHPEQMPGQEIADVPSDVPSGNVINPRPLPDYNPSLPPGAPGPSVDHTTDPGSILGNDYTYGNGLPSVAEFGIPQSPTDSFAPPSMNNVYESPHIPQGIINDGMMAQGMNPDIEIGNPNESVRRAPTMMFSTGGKVEGK